MWKIWILYWAFQGETCSALLYWATYVKDSCWFNTLFIVKGADIFHKCILQVCLSPKSFCLPILMLGQLCCLLLALTLKLDTFALPAGLCPRKKGSSSLHRSQPIKCVRYQPLITAYTSGSRPDQATAIAVKLTQIHQDEFPFFTFLISSYQQGPYGEPSCHFSNSFPKKNWFAQFVWKEEASKCMVHISVRGALDRQHVCGLYMECVSSGLFEVRTDGVVFLRDEQRPWRIDTLWHLSQTAWLVTSLMQQRILRHLTDSFLLNGAEWDKCKFPVMWRKYKNTVFSWNQKCFRYVWPSVSTCQYCKVQQVLSANHLWMSSNF